MAALPSVSGERAVRVLSEGGMGQGPSARKPRHSHQAGTRGELIGATTSRVSSGNAARADPRGGDVGGRIRRVDVSRGIFGTPSLGRSEPLRLFATGGATRVKK
jgi:hypothetical protein